MNTCKNCGHSRELHSAPGTRCQGHHVASVGRILSPCPCTKFEPQKTPVAPTATEVKHDELMEHCMELERDIAAMESTKYKRDRFWQVLCALISYDPRVGRWSELTDKAVAITIAALEAEGKL